LKAIKTAPQTGQPNAASYLLYRNATYAAARMFLHCFTKANLKDGAVKSSTLACYMRLFYGQDGHKNYFYLFALLY
jgi:hypothetical protein